MIFLREGLVLIATIAYSIGLSFSIYDKTFQKRLFKLVLAGVFTGFTLTAVLVEILVRVTRYDQLPAFVVALVFAPIVEELTKFLTIYYLGHILQGTVSEFEMIRLCGGLGLGFSSIETLGYIFHGVAYDVTVGRLLVTSPFHIGSALLIGIGLTKRKLSVVLPLVIFFHFLTNASAHSSVLLEGVISWVALFILYCFSEVDHNIKLPWWKKMIIRAI